MSSGFGFVDELVTGDALKKALAVRDKAFLEASVSKKRLPSHEEAGWRVHKEGKTSVRIRLDKTARELLEDELWSLAAKLGFKELNKDREFKILGNGSHRKIDIFAKDDEAALIIECTCADAPGSQKNMLPLIDKIRSYREDIVKAAMAFYGREPGLKFGWIIATRNVSWSDANLESAQKAGIVVLRDEEIDYFRNLQRLLGVAARFQLLAHVFRESPIKGLKIQVPATRGKMGGAIFYNFLISPEDLLKISYVAHKRSRGADAIDVYQRMLKPGRLKDIASYIDEGGRFPTNIVINITTDKKLRFDQKQDIGDCAFGELYLPNQYASAWIIDGQHRLYGFALSSRLSNSVVPVLAFENLPATEQKRLFIDINHKQVKVNKGLLIDLYSELHWDADDPEDRLTSLCSKIVKSLEGNKASPFHARIVIGEEGKTPVRCLTLTALASELEKLGLVGKASQGQFVVGPLGHTDSLKALKRSTEFLSLYFSAVRAARAQQWELGDAKGGYICTNNAVVAMLRVLRDIFQHLERDGVSLGPLNPAELLEHVMDYARPLLTWLTEVDEAKLAALRSKVGSIGQTAVTREFLAKINGEKPQFSPPGLKEWLDSLDKQGTREAKDLLDEIQRRINKCIRHVLKQQFPDGNNWWDDGVPEKIRLECVNNREREKSRHPPEAYFFLIHYKEIALEHWTNVFQPYFAIFGASGRKEQQVNWLVQLNEIRKTVSHPERGYLNKEQVDFVRKVHAELEKTMKDFPSN